MANDQQVMTKASDIIDMPEELFTSLLKAGQQARQSGEHQVTADRRGRKSLTHSSLLDKRGKRLHNEDDVLIKPMDRKLLDSIGSIGTGSTATTMTSASLLTLGSWRSSTASSTGAQLYWDPSMASWDTESLQSAPQECALLRFFRRMRCFGIKFQKTRPAYQDIDQESLDSARRSLSRSLKQQDRCKSCSLNSSRRDSRSAKASSWEGSSARIL
jgi:hypothetical protein